METEFSAESWQTTYARVGQFMKLWADMESALDAVITHAYSLSDVQALVMLSNIDLGRKVFVARSILQFLPIGESERDPHSSMLKELEKKLELRNMVAHVVFHPDVPTGGVAFVQTKARAKLERATVVWTPKEFDDVFLELADLTHRLAQLCDVVSGRSVKNHLSHLFSEAYAQAISNSIDASEPRRFIGRLLQKR